MIRPVAAKPSGSRMARAAAYTCPRAGRPPHAPATLLPSRAEEIPIMPTANDVIAHSLTLSGAMLYRYADDLAAQEMLHRPTPKANCAAWTIGHLVLTERNLLKRLGVADLPALPDGFEK